MLSEPSKPRCPGAKLPRVKPRIGYRHGRSLGKSARGSPELAAGAVGQKPPRGSGPKPQGRRLSWPWCPRRPGAQHHCFGEIGRG